MESAKILKQPLLCQPHLIKHQRNRTDNIKRIIQIDPVAYGQEHEYIEQKGKRKYAGVKPECRVNRKILLQDNFPLAWSGFNQEILSALIYLEQQGGLFARFQPYGKKELPYGPGTFGKRQTITGSAD